MNFPQVKGRLEKDYPLKKLNTWKIGGHAEWAFWPEDANEFVQIINWCKKNTLPYLILGRGSNVLLPDEGLKGLVIVTTKLNRSDWQEEIVRVEAGVSIMQMAREAANRGLKGLEFACGIPGTIGAAVVINAGAYDGKIGSLVQEVKVLSPDGETIVLGKEELSFGYRSSSLLEKGYLVLESTFRLEAGGESTAINEVIDGIMTRRAHAQPLEYPSAGSVFRNPKGDSVGRLIEQAGWKGYRIGDAQVSEKHANFIVNRGTAKAQDVLKLINEIQEDIRLKFGIDLETEIRVITG